jgi:hypothetical protein
LPETKRLGRSTITDKGTTYLAPAGRIVLGSSQSYSKLEKINQCLEAITPAYLFTLLVCPSIIANPNFIDAPPPRTRYLCGDFDLNPETVGSKSEFL